jgi:glutamine amidotransferase
VTRLAVIDHGAGNLVSVARGLEQNGARVDVVTEPVALAACDGVVLPGVGTTRAAMEQLESQGLVAALEVWEGPLLGICVGLQLFFETSDEDNTPCLGFIEGRVAQLESAPLLPHIGWNDVELAPDPLFGGLGRSTLFYFVHSYAPIPTDPADAIGWSEYGERFVAAARRGNRVGVQFHPERSGEAGLAVLANFIAECKRGRRAA